MEIRRELDVINKHFDWMYRTQGEVVVWYEFLPVGDGSEYDSVYDEGPAGNGGKAYKQGILLPVLRVQEREDQKRAIPEARLPFQNIMLFVSAKTMRDVGVENIWEYETHFNDMFKWDGRFYSVHDYMVRGRLRSEVYIMIEGLQVYVDDEMVNDPGPLELSEEEPPWPSTLPSLL
jgi:hypothetical protein